jgi:hypothetical protein
MFSNNPANVLVEHRSWRKSNYNLIRILSLVAHPVQLLSLASPPGEHRDLGFFPQLTIGLVLIVNKLLDKVAVEGWTGMMVMLAFFNGVVILILGMLGEYTARILQQISTSAVYHVREVVGYGR